MIRLVVQDLEAPVDLFQKDETAHLVQEGHIGHPDALICPLQQRFSQAQRTSDHETEFRSVDEYRIDLLRKRDRIDRLPVEVHEDHVFIGIDLFQHPLRFPVQDGFLVIRDLLVPYFDDLDPVIARYLLDVVVDQYLKVLVFDLADTEDLNHGSHPESELPRCEGP